MTDNKAIVLQDADLQLVVSTKTLGSLTTNAENIREAVKAALPQYSLDNYSSDNIGKAKEDKAKLNKAAKMLNDERIKIEKEWMKPFGDFKEVVTETVGLIKQCVSEIDTIVKADEERAKNEKKKQVEELAESLNVAEVISLEKIWNDKWLNKTASLKSIEKEITERLNGIKSDLETLKTFAEDYDVLVTYYKDCLNLNDSVAYANRLKKAREDKEGTKTEEAPKVKAAESPKQEEQPQQPSSINDADVNDAFAAAMGIDIVPVEKKVIYQVEVPSTMRGEFEEYLNKFGFSFNIM